MSLCRVGAALFLFAHLAGCDPVASVHARIVVPPEAMSSYRGTFPAQVLVLDDHDTHQTNAPPHATRVAVMCEANGKPLELTYDRGGVGCAELTHLTAFVAPLPGAETTASCGQLESPRYVESPPPVASPAGSATLFSNQAGKCGNYQDQAEITLTAH